MERESEETVGKEIAKILERRRGRMRRLPTAIFEAKVLFKFRGLYYYDNPSLKREKEGFIERIALEFGKTAEELKRNALVTITKKRIPKTQTKRGEEQLKQKNGQHRTE